MATTDNTTQTQSETAKAGLIYGLEDRPPLRETLFAAAQHLLAIFVAIVTPPLIIAGALGLGQEDTSFLVSMSLMVSGVATFIQCRRIGGIGCGLLCIQGTSFSFIGPIIAAGLAGGLPAIFGATVAGSVVEMFVSRILKYARRVITPLGEWHCGNPYWHEPHQSRHHSLWWRRYVGSHLWFFPKRRYFCLSIGAYRAL